MYDSPLSLQELCIDTICCNLDLIFDQYYDNLDNLSYSTNFHVYKKKDNLDSKQLKKYRFKQTDLFLYNVISEQILLKLGENNLLTDSSISLFTDKNTRLRHVYLKNAELLTVKGLKILKSHKIVDLDCSGIKVSVNDIIASLNDWSLEHLESLNLSKCNFIDSSRYSAVVWLSKLKNLRALNVSYSEFNQQGLKIVCEDMKRLEQLDISCTLISDLTPLLDLTDQLTSLTVFNYNLNKNRNLVSVILQLKKLKYLDLSSEKDEFLDDSPLGDLLRSPKALPNLLALDLSGKLSFDINHLVKFVQSHPNLTFLGLVNCQACYEDIFSDESHPEFRSGLKVAGTATESQIFIALRRYTPRAIYIQKCLYYLFRMTPSFRASRPDVVSLVLPGMQAHPRQFGVQMAATACLYNLTKGEMSMKIHPVLLSKAVNLTLIAMRNFPTHYQLQKNALLTLCSDRILQDVAFDRFRCAKLVLDSLCAFDDSSMNRMAVAICSILAAKISTNETSILGADAIYMRKLLTMVESKVDNVVVDITMKFTLSALWNLTDESAVTCRIFLQEGGIKLFLRVLEVFSGDSTVETKVLGLVNNIAEVPSLRCQILLEPFVKQLKNLLNSPHIDVSYFAAGIIAHLASDGDEVWHVTSVTRREIVEELGRVVTKWEVPDGEMVAYRSFLPFFPLLRPEIDFQIQLWAVWAVHHVCTKNPQRYCSMLVAEGGPELLQRLLDDDNTHSSIKHFANLVLDVFRSEQSH